MTILAGDIKLVASQVMDDVSEGGGAPTSVVIADGVDNSIFNDISELDRAGGRVNLRKAFVSVQTNNRDGYFGANVIVADAPDDPLVSVTLFSTKETFDERVDAKARIESYLAQGPTYAGYLFGNHIAGQMNISILARTNVVPPVVGDSYVLKKLEGTGGEFTQFVRITDVSVTPREFEDASGIFTRSEITLDISDPLRADFPGFDALRFDTSMSFVGKTKVATTIVADAARYFGVVPLMADAGTGDFSLQASGIFTQLVPSAQIETPIADARMNQSSAALVPAGSVIAATVITVTFTTTQAMFVGGGILPGSLSISRSGITLVDSGGKLINSADSTQVGNVDYSNGSITLATNVFGISGGSHTVTYTPAAQPVVISQSFGIPVTQAGQRLTYVTTLSPVPAKASTTISYRAQGRWYVMTEDGSGALRGGDSSVGVGTLNFTTGTLSLTLGALPDVDSEVIVGYLPVVGTPNFASQPTLPSPIDARMFHAIELGRAIKPGTVSVTWTWSLGNYTATDDGTGGLTGHAVGEVDYARGFVRLSPNVLPAEGTVFTVAITEAAADGSDVTFADGGATWSFTLAGTVRAGSVQVAVIGTLPVRQFPGQDVISARFVRVFDDGAGLLKVAAVTGALTIGAINYGTGVCSINKTLATYQDVQSTFDVTEREFDGAITSSSIGVSGSETRTLTLTVLNGSISPPAAPVWAWWAGSFTSSAKAKASGADVGAFSHAYPLNNLYARRAYTQFVLANAVTYGRGTAGNSLVRGVDAATGVGTLAGSWSTLGSDVLGSFTNRTVGDTGGYIVATSWFGAYGVAPVISATCGVLMPVTTGANSPFVTDGATFRTAIAPIRNGSFSVVGSFKEGATFNATADSDGVLKSGSNYVNPSTPGSWGVFGKINYSTGVVKVRFGRRTHPDNAAGTGVVDMSDLGIAGVQYVEVAGALSDTLRYNAAAFVYLPLDAEILGIDPVRLPSDGRVPIFRPGTFAVVGNTAIVASHTYANGNDVNFGRVRLSRVRVIGNDGVVINTGYTTDLEAGTLHVTSIAGWAQPVTIEHRIEDMMLVSDAQINGQLTFTRALTHDYPAGSYVSSALVIGDMTSRVSVLFDQQTWGNVWSDALTGSSATATYNDISNPLEVTNKGASTERWALVFTGSTAFNIIGEHVGVIGTGNTSTNCSPINPATDAPYFVLDAAGWGIGWAAGNVLRFNTVGSLFPVWIVRTIQQGPETIADDSFTVLIRGDVDHP